jgi:hypothetical protein
LRVLPAAKRDSINYKSEDFQEEAVTFKLPGSPIASDAPLLASRGNS